MQEDITLVKEIKRLEEKVRKNKKDLESRNQLRDNFTKLQTIEDGPLAYINVTAPEEIEQIYKINVMASFAKLDKKNVKVMDYSNPNNYAFLPENLSMIAIERTPKNKELAIAIIKQIITAMGSKP